MLDDQEILDAVPHNQGFDERTKWLWFGRFIESVVISHALAKQDRLSKEWEELWGPIDAAVRPITPLGESVSAKALELINSAKAIHSQQAADLNTNERGEPDAIYLQLHDPDDVDVTQAADYRGDGVTWCWEPIHENDVRYVREDLSASPQAKKGAYYVIDPRGPNENGDYYLTGADIQNLITSKK